MCRRRAEILSTTDADLAVLADAADAVRDHGGVVVVTSEEGLAKYHGESTHPPFTSVIRPLQQPVRE